MLPEAGTFQSFPSKESLMRLRYTISFPSGVQPMTMLFGPMRSPRSSRLLVPVKVSRTGSPPVAGIEYTSVLPSY